VLIVFVNLLVLDLSQADFFLKLLHQPHLQSPLWFLVHHLQLLQSLQQRHRQSQQLDRQQN
jgi:hypothetical protein